MGDAVAGNKISGDQVAGNKIVYTTPPGDDPASLVRRYLAHVIRETQRLTFIDADSADAEQEGLFLTRLPGMRSRHCHAHCTIGCAPAIWAPSVAQTAG